MKTKRLPRSQGAQTTGKYRPQEPYVLSSGYFFISTLYFGATCSSCHGAAQYLGELDGEVSQYLFLAWNRFMRNIWWCRKDVWSSSFICPYTVYWTKTCCDNITWITSETLRMVMYLKSCLLEPACHKMSKSFPQILVTFLLAGAVLGGHPNPGVLTEQSTQNGWKSLEIEQPC